MSRRTFLSMTGAALLAGCSSSSTSGVGTATPGGSPTLAPGKVLLPAARIEPDNAGQVAVLGVLDTQTSPVRGIAWSPDGSTLALSAYQNAQLWDVTAGQRMATLRGHTDEIDGIAWSPDGAMLATASRDGSVRLWDAHQHTALKVLRSATNPAPIISVAWSRDSRKLASGNGVGVVQLWDAATGNRLATWNGPPSDNSSPRFLAEAVYGIGWSPDGQRIAANRYDDYLRIWEARSGKSIAVLATLTGPNGLAWSPDGRLLSVGTDTGTIQIWNTQTWKNSATLLPPGDSAGWTYSVPWTPDGQLLAASRQDGTLQLWNAGTGKKLASLTGHTSSIWAAAWSPDGLRLASGSDDGTARLWGVHQA
jgi:WD40 repeat protein